MPFFLVLNNQLLFRNSINTIMIHALKNSRLGRYSIFTILLAIFAGLNGCSQLHKPQTIHVKPIKTDTVEITGVATVIDEHRQSQVEKFFISGGTVLGAVTGLKVTEKKSGYTQLFGAVAGSIAGATIGKVASMFANSKIAAVIYKKTDSEEQGTCYTELSKRIIELLDEEFAKNGSYVATLNLFGEGICQILTPKFDRRLRHEDKQPGFVGRMMGKKVEPFQESGSASGSELSAEEISEIEELRALEADLAKQEASEKAELLKLQRKQTAKQKRKARQKKIENLRKKLNGGS